VNTSLNNKTLYKTAANRLELRVEKLRRKMELRESYLRVPFIYTLFLIGEAE
jgi:hypothetical protein